MLVNSIFCFFNNVFNSFRDEILFTFTLPSARFFRFWQEQHFKLKVILIIEHFSNARQHILSLSQTTNFRLLQTQRVWRWQFQTWWKWQKVLKTGRRHCKKSRKCSLWAISPFSALFSKDMYCRHVRIGLVWERVNYQALHYVLSLPKHAVFWFDL